jgi:guanylate kinase
MAIQSMTGFAREAGTTGPLSWAWELKSVNGRGLEVRLRVPPGFDSAGEDARRQIAGAFSRGQCQLSLTVSRASSTPRVSVNREALEALITALGSLKLPDEVRPASLDGLLAVRGIVEIEDEAADPAAGDALRGDLTAAAGRLVEALKVARAGEGLALQRVIEGQLSEISRLVDAAEACPGRHPDAIRAKLAEQVAALMGAAGSLDPARLHQEAALLATRTPRSEGIGRPPAGLPRPGIRTRSQHALLEGKRRVAVAHRAGAESRGRAVSRAGPERRMSAADEASASVQARVGRRGLILILSSPSGAGKTSLTRALREEKELGLEVSVSVTTRAKRPSEIAGRDYTFISVDDFMALRDHDDLLEWAEVHGNFYGTPRRPVERALAAGTDMIFDIDYQGTRQVRASMGDDVVTVFILPPSMAELKHRLERRAEDTRETIDKRLGNARVEIERWSEYDYVVVNEDLGASFAGLKAILSAERLKRERQVGLPAFVGELLAESVV